MMPTVVTSDLHGKQLDAVAFQPLGERCQARPVKAVRILRRVGDTVTKGDVPGVEVRQ
ncbi:hypothetical protein [Microcella alkaliphila]|uniref:Phosphoribosylformylglycinamidine synthase n=1 Tax=Microcella alkaliphila TaxID=279828 RepID=A0A0U4WUJ0_9MICO|nr:hypothetical protein [Microcella alkaliphila]BAU31528.1 phosphoribosylformylglycinamidine synthase [Microcella alkaliphila]